MEKDLSNSTTNVNSENINSSNNSTYPISIQDTLIQILQFQKSLSERQDKLEEVIFLKNENTKLPQGTTDDNTISTISSQSTGNATIENTDEILFKIQNDIRKEIENYSGEDINDSTVKFSEWKDDIRDFIKVNSDFIPDEHFKIKLVGLRLKDKAHAWFEENESTFQDYEEAIDRLENHFLPLNKSWCFLSKLNDYNPNGKSLKQITNDFEKIVKDAPKEIPPMMLSWELLRLIPLGIRELLMKQYRDSNTTWQQIKDLAVCMESVPSLTTNKSNKLDGRIGKPDVEKKKKTIRCLRCHQKGHFGDRCPIYPNKSRKKESLKI